MRHAKKRQIDSIVFDDCARLEFLTGFQKRNLQKKEVAKSKAKERERKERLQARKEQRQALKEQAEENVRLVEGAWKQDVGDVETNDEDVLVSLPSDKGKGKATQEFEDEQQLATVTIVDELDLESLRHGSSMAKPTEPVAEAESLTREPSQSVAEKNTDRRMSPDNNSVREKGKLRPKRTPYETKAARKAARIKQRARKLEKADRAGTRRGGRRKGEKKVRKVP